MRKANGSQDVTTYFVLRDSTNHAPKTDVTITDIDLYYCEQGAAMAAKVDATALAAADSAHGDNQAFHCGLGLYRIDWPDEAFNGGAGKVVNLIVVCTGVDTTFLEVELDADSANITAIKTKTDFLPDAAPLDEAGLLAAVGLATGNLDTQLGALPTAAENAAAMFAAAAGTYAAAGEGSVVKEIADNAGGSALTEAGIAAAVAAQADIAAGLAKLGTPAADLAADIAALPTAVENAAAVAAQADIAAAMAKLGTPAGASISADIAALPTAEEIEDQVLDAPLAEHAGAGSVGAGIAAAQSAGDPWATDLPGAYAAGTAGAKLTQAAAGGSPVKRIG